MARSGKPETVISIYKNLITPDATGTAVALDAAETMLDNGHREEAESLLNTAHDLAHQSNREWIDRRAQELRDRIG